MVHTAETDPGLTASLMLSESGPIQTCFPTPHCASLPQRKEHHDQAGPLSYFILFFANSTKTFLAIFDAIGDLAVWSPSVPPPRYFMIFDFFIAPGGG